jgi:hypothetical protein
MLRREWGYHRFFVGFFERRKCRSRRFLMKRASHSPARSRKRIGHKRGKVLRVVPWYARVDRDRWLFRHNYDELLVLIFLPRRIAHLCRTGDSGVEGKDIKNPQKSLPNYCQRLKQHKIGLLP